MKYVGEPLFILAREFVVICSRRVSRVCWSLHSKLGCALCWSVPTLRVTIKSRPLLLRYLSTVSLPPLQLELFINQINTSTMSGKVGGKSKGGKASGGETKSQSRSSKAGLQFPVGRIHRLLKKGNYAQRVGAGAPGKLITWFQSFDHGWSICIR